MDDWLLVELFHFKHKRPSVYQSSDTCRKLVDVFARFVESVEVVTAAEDPYLHQTDPFVVKAAPWTSPPAPSFSSGEVHELRRICDLTRPRTNAGVGESWIKEWMPAYGCAIQVDVLSVARAQVKVVFPDGWKRVLHFLPSGECVHSAVPTMQGEIHCGNVDPAFFGDFEKAFQQEMSEAQKRKGNDRSAASGNDVGHQKTPSFAAAIIKKALFSVKTRSLQSGKQDSTPITPPTGGTTDVGMHTGGQPRATCWPVVCSVFQHNLSDGGALWQKTRASFQLFLLRMAVAQARSYKDQQEPQFSQQAVGTGAPSYQPTREVEPSGVGMANYVSISRMSAYSHKSTEEPRYEDYLKRTNPAAAQAAATQNAPASATAGTTQLHQCVGKLCDKVDDLFAMLQSVVRLATSPLEVGHDVSRLQAMCGDVREDIDSLASTASQWLGTTYTLPYSAGLQAWAQSETSIMLVPPLFTYDPPANGKFGDIHQYAMANLGYGNFIDGSQCSFQDLAKWIDTTRAVAGTSSYAMVVILRCVERYMIAASVSLIKTVETNLRFAPAELQALVTKYSSCVATYNQQKASNAHLAVEQRSLELLVKWTAFCLVHKQCREAWPLLNKFKIALNWEDLRVAVFSDRGAIEALRNVAQYIRAVSSVAPEPPVFHLTEQDGTLKFARSFAGCDDELLRVYEEETRAWNAYVNEMWSSIETKKKQAAELRSEIAEQEITVEECREELEDAKLRRQANPTRQNGQLSMAANTDYQRSRSKLNALHRQLRSTLQMPGRLVRPLPSDKSDAMAVLFFAHMPRALEVLGEMCVAAQKALCPAQPSKEMLTQNEYHNHTALQDHYCTYSRFSHTDIRRVFVLSCAFGSIPMSIGPTTVDGVHYKHTYESQCVWAPSLDTSRFRWNNPVDPFRVTTTATREEFIERMPGSFARWQWMNSYPGGDTRGSRVYAAVSDEAGAGDDGVQEQGALDDSEFISLGLLRAFPNQQFRQLLCALHTDSLPWDNACVQVVVRQALYQVGDLTDDERPALRWKTDLMAQPGGTATFDAVLDALAAMLEQTPRAFEQVPLLSELASFAGQFAGGARKVSVRFTRMARAWADQALSTSPGSDGKKALGASSSVIAERRARACLLYGYALISYSLAEPVADKLDVQDMCELVVNFHTNLLFTHQISESMRAVLLSLEQRVHDVMAHHIASFVSCVSGDSEWQNEFLASLIGPVVNGAGTNPLLWSQQQTTSGDGTVSSTFYAYEASTGTHYSVNLFTGSVLTNGNAPGGLPVSIRSHARYKELFGDADFEITPLSPNWFRTMSEHDGVCYEFGLDGPELSVVEMRDEPDGALIEKRTRRTFRLCSTKWRESFESSHYPTRLAKLYCHWHWVEEDCVVLRSPNPSDRRVWFIVKLDPASDGDDDGIETVNTRCFRVPATDVALSYAILKWRMLSYERLVRVNDRIASVMCKFEARGFIHVLKPPMSHNLRVELPRFNLSFKLTTMSNGEWVFASEQYAGYILKREQQFGGGFLPRFSHYLVLERDPLSGADVKAVNVRVLVPQGCVENTGMMRIRVAAAPSAQIPVVCYDQHLRLGTFVAETVSARLELASIYASGGTSVPCAMLGMTCAEAAIQQLRCCSSSRPYSTMETELLENVCALGYREPSLRLLAANLLERASQLAFLFEDHEDRSQHQPAEEPYQHVPRILMDYTDEQDAYAEQCRDSLRCRLRYQLPEHEDALVNPVRSFSGMGVFASGQSRTDTEVKLLPSPVPSVYVKNMEKTLADFVKLAPVQSNAQIPSFPLRTGGVNALGCAMNMDLEESWDIYHSQEERQISPEFASPSALHSRLVELFDEVTAERQIVELYLYGCYSRATSDSGSQLRKLVSYIVTKPTRADFLRCALSKAVVGLLAPRLGHNGQQLFQRGAQQFLELCVLEDKLERVVAMAASELGASSWASAASQQQQRLMEELMCVRPWDITEHPYWLAFEVEGRIQIRPEQFVVAKHLLDNPGSMCQLNMGRGKTRVILPMLFLYLANRKADARATNAVSTLQKATRATILTSLVSEMRQFLQRFLVASNAELGFVEMPFHRLIALDERAVQLISERLERAKSRGEVLLVAPEHRMSLELKLIELQSSNDAVSATSNESKVSKLLAGLLDNNNYMDVIDESDAVLHHKYHLVYADGPAAEPLGNGPARWEAAQALLKLVAISRHSASTSRVSRVLMGDQDGPRSCWAPDYADRLGAYDGTRLLPPLVDDASASLASMGQHHAQHGQLDLKQALIEDLLDGASDVYPWAAAFCKRYPALRSRLVLALSDASTSINDAVGDEFAVLLAPYRSQLLALRGFVAFGVMEHCLEKRYRVEFGLPEEGKAKRLAIPFRAADVPSERSEFSHPDVAIALTLLGYYHTGLRNHELRAAFSELLRLDASEQEHRYTQWYTSVLGVGQPRLTSEEQEMLRDVRHLSLSDERQFALVCRVFEHCMLTIDFFLSTFVFPHETRQYPQRLTRSAWHLAANKDAIMGFSGTNDNELLLPLLVKQNEPNAEDLLATNGKMLDCILKATNGVELVQSNDREASAPSWQNVLKHALVKGAQALIDTGALLAGVATHDAARFVYKQAKLNKSGGWTGVTYFDTRSKHNCWAVLDKTTGREMPLAASHIVERDTFVIFDEARSRGSDMKLRTDASAIVTLGQRLTKDKLMQGAGRMRQLGESGGGQTLWFVCLEDVAQRIRTHVVSNQSATAPLGTVGVLDWVMHNTKTEVTHGMIEWAGSGIQFERSRQDPSEEVVRDDWTLETLYATAHSAKKLAEIVKAKIVDRYSTSNDSEDSTLPTELVSMIERQALTFGLEDEAFVTAHTDECERELQFEEQLEEEREVEGRLCSPVREYEWMFDRVVGASSVEDMRRVVHTVGIGDFFSRSVKTTGNDELRKLMWGTAGDVRGTVNFFHAVVEGDRASTSWTERERAARVSSEWLRVTNSVLVFDDGSMLLLSEYEADHVLEVLWGEASAPSNKSVPMLCNLAFVLDLLKVASNAPALAVPYPSAKTQRKSLYVASIVACALWNGETMFVSRASSEKDGNGKTLDGRVAHALRKLLALMKTREEAMRAFVDARGQGHRWKCSPLQKLCSLMDLETCRPVMME